MVNNLVWRFQLTPPKNDGVKVSWDDEITNGKITYLAFYLAYLLAYLLAFHLTNLLAFYLAFI